MRTHLTALKEIALRPPAWPSIRYAPQRDPPAVANYGTSLALRAGDGEDSPRHEVSLTRPDPPVIVDGG